MNLHPLIHRIQHRLERWDHPHAVANDLAHTLDAFLATHFIPSTTPHTRPGHFEGQLLYEDPLFGFIVVEMFWGAHATTPVHAHGTWGVFGVLSGQLTFTNYGHPPGAGHLTPISEFPTHPGDVTHLLWPTIEVHRVENRDHYPAKSLHIYGRNIGF